MPMKKGLLQEKFQRTVEDPKTNGGHTWTSFEKVRRSHDLPMRSYSPSEAKIPYASGASFSAPITNRLPPGMNIDNQDVTPAVNTPYSNAGATDESNSVNGKMLRDGFQRQNMNGTDDLYTNEHVEEFYGEAEGEDDAGNKYSGYIERNNYLDRN